MNLRPLLGALALVLICFPALAADPVYPSGIRVGLVPLIGLARATTFPGFESQDQNVRVLVTELPAAAFNEAAKAVSGPPGSIRPQPLETAAGTGYFLIDNGGSGSDNIKRYMLFVAGEGFSGYVAVQVPENAAKIYTDEAVKQMLASVATRKEVPVEEQLALLPFRVTELAGFRTVRAMMNGTLMLTDSKAGENTENAPVMIIGLITGTPTETDARSRFARELALQIPGMRDIRVTVSEPMRISATPGYETRLDAVTGKDKTEVTVVQWLRFNGGVSLRVIASAPRDQWLAAFTRFREVRDGIRSKNGG
ncbi:MAG: hypothetical protein FWD68_21225 [Alphaproteobacteria bacterium]|nr:hypothetical protein [Alphaproteobacteria bacterium]